MFPASTFSLLLVVFSGLAAIYYAVILSGLYKDPLMARLRQYGEEDSHSILTNMLVSAGVCSLLTATLIPAYTLPTSYVRRTFPPWMFVCVALALFGMAIFVQQRPALRDALPRWYWELLQCCSRQERRQIAYAWMRIPRGMRLRLSGDQKSFQVWAELVRLTVIYGAHDPDSPWDRWT